MDWLKAFNDEDFINKFMKYDDEFKNRLANSLDIVKWCRNNNIKINSITKDLGGGLFIELLPTYIIRVCSNSTHILYSPGVQTPFIWNEEFKNNLLRRFDLKAFW